MRKLISFLLLSFVAYTLQAQIKDPVKFKTELNSLSDTEAEIVFTAAIDKGWHVYSTDLGDGGPISATFNVDSKSGIEPVGKLKPVGKEIATFDKLFEMKVRYFENTAKFIQKVKFTGGAYAIEGYLEYGACNDESCLPPTQVPFKFAGEAKGNTVAAKEDKSAKEDKAEKKDNADKTETDLAVSKDTVAMTELLSATPVDASTGIQPAVASSELWKPVISELQALGEEHGQGDDTLEGKFRVPVGKAPQQGLAHNARQAAHRGHQPGLPVGKAPVQQQGGLIAHDGGKHGPKADLHGHIVPVQPPEGGLSLYGQGSFLRMFILEQVVQPGGARSVEGEGYIRLQARNGVQQIPLEIPQIDGGQLRAGQGQEGGEGAGKGVPQQHHPRPVRIFVVGDGGDWVVAAGVVGIGIAVEPVLLGHPLGEAHRRLKGAGAGKTVGGAGIGQLGVEFGGIKRDVVRPGVEGAHPLALAAQEEVLQHPGIPVGRIGEGRVGGQAVPLLQLVRQRLPGEKGRLRLPVVIGAEKPVGVDAVLLKQGAQIQIVRSLPLQLGQEGVGALVAVLFHPRGEQRLPTLELLWGVHVEIGDSQGLQVLGKRRRGGGVLRHLRPDAGRGLKIHKIQSAGG
jgi:hypothetical protein